MKHILHEKISNNVGPSIEGVSLITTPRTWIFRSGMPVSPSFSRFSLIPERRAQRAVIQVFDWCMHIIALFFCSCSALAVSHVMYYNLASPLDGEGCFCICSAIPGVLHACNKLANRPPALQNNWGRSDVSTSRRERLKIMKDVHGSLLSSSYITGRTQYVAINNTKSSNYLHSYIRCSSGLKPGSTIVYYFVNYMSTCFQFTEFSLYADTANI